MDTAKVERSYTQAKPENILQAALELLSALGVQAQYVDSNRIGELIEIPDQTLREECVTEDGKEYLGWLIQNLMAGRTARRTRGK